MAITRPQFSVNYETCRQNIRKMAGKAKKHNLQFRPHFKTHHSKQTGRLFREMGISQITVSSLQMAHYFIEDSWDDIVVAFPLNIREMDNYNSIDSSIRTGLLIDSEYTANFLSKSTQREFDIYIEIDTGYKRSGIWYENKKAIKEVIEIIDATKLLNFKGLLTHNGVTYRAKSADEIEKMHRKSVDIMHDLKQELNDNNKDLIASIGDTPGCTLSNYFKGIDEIRPGNFVYFDLMQHSLGVCEPKDIAVTVDCPVVSVYPERKQCVIYGGAIHFSKDGILVEGKPIWGCLAGRDSSSNLTFKNAVLTSVSQEHGILSFSDNMVKEIKPGDLLSIVPVHSCLTANLFR